METTIRTVAKAISWQVSGLTAMTLIGYLMTGSLEAGGSIAVVSTMIGFAAYFVHEKIWSRVRWGRISPMSSGC